MRYARFAPALLTLVVVALAVAFLATPASAETITVTRADDPAPDGCATNGCSFREAAQLGNSTAGNQVIDIGTLEIVLESTVSLTGDMTIQGASQTTAIIRSSNGAHLFNVTSGANVTFTKVWVQSGGTPGPDNCGGAVHNAGTLTVIDARIAKNFIQGNGAGLCNLGTANISKSRFMANGASGLGGAIYNRGTMTITDSTIETSQAVEGGGVFNHADGTLTITGSTFDDNTAESGCSDCDSGGGISNNGMLTIEYSTVSNNTADNGAGLVNRGTATIRRSTFNGNTNGAIFNSSGTTSLVRSTVSGNTGKSGSTSGIAGVSNSSTLSITSSTIVNNPPSGFQYGGVYTSTQGSTSYRASIIGNNGPGNCHTGGNQTSQGGNVFSPQTSACKSDGGNDIEVDDVGVGALADNGGPTLTHMPAANSPAINRLGCVAGPDQRGALIADGQCDAGSVERSGTAPTPDPSATPAPAGYPMGDVSCNDGVGSEDLLPALKLAAKLAAPDRCGRTQLPCFNYEGACYPPWVDTNCDNKMTGADVLPIAAHLSGAPVQNGGCPPVGQQIPHN